MSTLKFFSNFIYNFPCRISSVSCSLPYTVFPQIMRNGKNQLVPRHDSPRFISTKIVGNSRTTNESEFNFDAYRLGKLNSINKALEAAVPLKESMKLVEAVRYSLLSDGGRKIPILCLSCCELVGGTESIAMPVACAIEMLRTMGMVADDLPSMDNDDFRPGKPSTHKLYGEAMTILVSYSLIGLAFEHIARATKLGVSSANIIRVSSELARLMIGAEGLSGGQAADLDSQGKSGIGIERVEYIHLHKASPAFEAAAVAGAIVGGASEQEINRIRKFGKCTGLLYQIQDDIHDHEEDLIAGRATYTTVIGKEKSKELIDKLIKEAKDELFGFDSEKAKPLRAFADFAAAHIKS